MLELLPNGIAASLTAMFLLLPASSLAASYTAVWGSANAGLETTPDSIRQTVGNTLLTARGYVAEFEDADPKTSTIIGPFSTGVAGSHQIFGPRTASTTDTNSYGLGLFVAASPGVAPSGFDYGGATYIAGFDSGVCCTQAYLSDNPAVPGLPRRYKTDFTIITFSQPVDISQFNTNTAPAWWAAGWTETPDLTNGLSTALSNATVIQSKGAQTDLFAHSLAGFSGITTLAIGYSPFAPGYASLGAYAPGDFFLYSVTLAPVPEPGSAWLTSAGLMLLIAAIRKRG